MMVVDYYSHKNGYRFIMENFHDIYLEVISIIETIDASICKTKTSREKRMPGKSLYSPKRLNREFSKEFIRNGWSPVRVACDYANGAFREMDFVKNSLGVEVQFGKYAFMVYNVCAKMTIFHKLGYIIAGIEIVPMKSLADEMSSGVSYFEQFRWDLQQRGVADIDIPVLVIGIDV